MPDAVAAARSVYKPRRLDQQPALAPIAGVRNVAELALFPRTALARNHAEVRFELVRRAKSRDVIDGRHERACGHWSHAWRRGEPRRDVILLCKGGAEP